MGDSLNINPIRMLPKTYIYLGKICFKQNKNKKKQIWGEDSGEKKWFICELRV